MPFLGLAESAFHVIIAPVGQKHRHSVRFLVQMEDCILCGASNLDRRVICLQKLYTSETVRALSLEKISPFTDYDSVVLSFEIIHHNNRYIIYIYIIIYACT